MQQVHNLAHLIGSIMIIVVTVAYIGVTIFMLM
jgi:hypothetical protein